MRKFLSLDGLTQLLDNLKNIFADKATALYKTPQELTVDEVNQVRQNLKLDDYASKDYVETLYKTLNSNTVLGFYCIEDVTIVTNGVSKVYPANSNVEVKFIEDDVFEIVPTSNNSILALTAFPSALGTFYPWLEGVAQFSNILFDMNAEDMYTKWSQGNQGLYHVQSAQYTNCIFWSDNPYISEVTKRTNYTLTHTSQLPLCYSSTPDNTFKTFYLAGGVISDPNWANQAYLDSFAKATWATQVFSYYGARTVGLPELSNITLPEDCRGLMFYARNVENAGTFDAANTTNFGAKSGSWRDAFGYCISLRSLYIKNLKVNLNVSWSPINYDSIYYIISEAINTNAITISVSPYTYNLLGTSDFELAASKNITIELLTTNYVEDRRLSDIANKADKTEVLLKKDKDLIVSRISDGSTTTTHTVYEIAEAIESGRTVRFLENVELFNLLEVNKDYGYATFFMLYVNQNEQLQSQVITIVENEIIDDINNIYDYAVKSEVLLKTAQNLTESELAQVRKNLKFIGKDVEGKTFTIDGTEVIASANAEIFGDYDNNIAVGQWSIAEGSGTVAKGRASHAEGAYSKALNDGCHVEGYQTQASGYWSHAEGEMTRVTSYASHAEGSYTKMPDGSTRYGTASGYASHVEGGGSCASGSASHAEGIATDAGGKCAHSEGMYTAAMSQFQHAEGQANIIDTENKYIHIAGNGTSPTDRSNAHTLDWDGNAEFMGDVVAHGCSSTDTPISLVAINTSVQSIQTEMNDYVEITSEEIRSYF